MTDGICLAVLTIEKRAGGFSLERLLFVSRSLFLLQYSRNTALLLLLSAQMIFCLRHMLIAPRDSCLCRRMSTIRNVEAVEIRVIRTLGLKRSFCSHRVTEDLFRQLCPAAHPWVRHGVRHPGRDLLGLAVSGLLQVHLALHGLLSRTIVAAVSD